MKRKIFTLAIGALFISIQPVQLLRAQSLTANFPKTKDSFSGFKQGDTSLKPLKDILKLISKTYHVNFIYEDRIVSDIYVAHPPKLKDKNIGKALSKILHSNGLDLIKLDDTNYSIVRQKKSGHTSNSIKQNAAFVSPLHGIQSASSGLVLSKSGQIAISRDTSVINGVVKDEKDNPVPGAVIAVKGTTTGAITNDRGLFSLKIPANNNTGTLLVHCVGYESDAIPLTSHNFYTVVIKSNVAALQTVVVNGITQRTYESYTGAVTSFDIKQLRSVGNQNVIASLKVLDPSFQVFENNSFGSDPNHLPNVQIRGASNLPDLKGNYKGNPNLPLFILDGFEVPMQKVYDLDMNRVEKVTILKDATATALYGSRGANGVVVINTKQPEPGKLQLSYTGDFTFQTPDLSSYHLLNGMQKLQAEKAAGLYTFKGRTDIEQLLDERYNRRLKEVKRGVNTDWLALPLQAGFGNRHYLYLEGGDAYLRYGVNFSYNNQVGVMKGSNRRTYSGGMMLSYRYKQLLFRNELSFTQNKSNNSPHGSFSDYVKMNPYWRIRDKDGNILKAVDTISTPGFIDPQLAMNPLYNSTINTRDYSLYTQMIDRFSLEWWVSQSFKLRGSFSLINQRNESDQFFPGDHTMFANYSDIDFFRKGIYTQGNGKSNSYETNAYLDFHRSWGKNLVFATGGFDLAQDNDNMTYVVGEGYPNELLDDILFASRYEKDGKPTGSESLARRISFQSNFNYSYDSRYVANFSLSTDGSSRFGTANKFAPFWSVGVGWNIQNEQWAKSLGIINRLKLHASYGITGSQNFPAYQAMTTYSYFTDTRYLNNIGAYLLGLGNEDLKWQQKKTINVGADISLWNGILALNANYYRDRTQNQLIDLSIPPSMGFSSYKENLGEVENNGYEIDVRVILIRNEQKKITWSINGTLFHNDNKLVKISDALDAYNKTQGENQKIDNNTTPVLFYKEGQPLTAIYAVPSLGIDPASGKEILVKKDGSLTYKWDPADEVVCGDANPKCQGIFGTNLLYKDFTFNVMFSFQTGAQTYNQTLVDRVEDADIRYNVDERVLLDRWQKPGDITFFKDIADKTPTFPSSRFVQDDKRLDCESISLQYDFKDCKFLQKSAMKTLRLGFYMNEPFQFRSIKQERGLIYPFAHTFSFSVQTGF